MTQLVLIAAVGRNGVIGRDNEMPWRLPSDLKRFRALTMGRPVIMGRKTFQSIGRALDGRANIVVSRDPSFSADRAETVTSLDAALERATGHAERTGADEICVIGGGEIYALAMPLADRLEITEVDAAPEGDARFPAIDPALWRETARQAGERSPRDSADVSYVTYERAG